MAQLRTDSSSSGSSSDPSARLLGRRSVPAALSFDRLLARQDARKNQHQHQKEAKEKHFQQKSKRVKHAERLKKQLAGSPPVAVAAAADAEEEQKQQPREEDDEQHQADTLHDAATAKRQKLATPTDSTDTLAAASIAVPPPTKPYSGRGLGWTNSSAIRQRVLQAKANKSHHVTEPPSDSDAYLSLSRPLTKDELRARRNMERSKMRSSTARGQPHLGKQVEVLYERLKRKVAYEHRERQRQVG